MVDLTIVNPTKNTFRTGQNINQACNLGLLTGIGNPTIGRGTMVTFNVSTISGNGSYAAFGNSGDWTLKISSNGNNFNIELQITGAAAKYARSFTASCRQMVSNTLKFVKLDDPGMTCTVSQNNGSWVSSGKIEANASWAPLTLYIRSCS
jgi:hypothetical protein